MRRTPKCTRCSADLAKGHRPNAQVYGSGRWNKANLCQRCSESIRGSLIYRMRKAKEIKADEWQALALAVVWSETKGGV